MRNIKLICVIIVLILVGCGKDEPKINVTDTEAIQIARDKIEEAINIEKIINGTIIQCDMTEGVERAAKKNGEYRPILNENVDKAQMNIIIKKCYSAETYTKIYTECFIGTEKMPPVFYEYDETLYYNIRRVVNKTEAIMDYDSLKVISNKENEFTVSVDAKTAETDNYTTIQITFLYEIDGWGIKGKITNLLK